MLLTKTISPNIFPELGADALAVPRMHDDRIPALTKHIYSKGDAGKISDMYKINKGKAYERGDDFVEEYDIEQERCNFMEIAAFRAKITVTKAYGLESTNILSTYALKPCACAKKKSPSERSHSYSIRVFLISL